MNRGIENAPGEYLCIWIVDDLVNIDAANSSASTGPTETGTHTHGNMSIKQPSDDCEGGSNNVMGLCSSLGSVQI